MSIQWRAGQRSLAASVVISLFLVFTLSRRHLRSRSNLWSSRPSDLTGLDLQTPPQSLPWQVNSEQPETPVSPSFPSIPQPDLDLLAPPDPSASDSSSDSSLFTAASCRLTKLSMLYGDAFTFAQVEAAMDTHRRHCERWGCKYNSLDRIISSRNYNSKIYFILLVVLQEIAKPESESSEWVLWVDADTMVLNPAISPCAFLPPAEHQQDIFALLTADHNGFNSGVFYLKVCEATVDLLTRTVAFPLVYPEVDLGWGAEQAAMIHVINETETKNQSNSGIVWVPREWFNTYELERGFEGKPGHSLVHFAGLVDTRLAHMAQWLNELEQHPEKWEVPMEKTFYAQGLPKFWAEFAANKTRSVR